MSDADDEGLPPLTTTEEARRYVLGVTVAMLEHELTDREGWMFDGVKADESIAHIRRQLRVELRRLYQRLGWELPKRLRR